MKWRIANAVVYHGNLGIHLQYTLTRQESGGVKCHPAHGRVERHTEQYKQGPTPHLHLKLPTACTQPQLQRYILSAQLATMNAHMRSSALGSRMAVSQTTFRLPQQVLF